MIQLDGDVAVVTGGAQGIGKAICHALGCAGARVVITDCDEEAGRECLADLKEDEIDAIFVPADVAKADDVARLMHRSAEHFDGVRIIVNNAGIGHTIPIEDLEIEDFDRVIDVNLRSAVLTAKYALPYMKQTGGTIVNIASTRAFMSEPNTESYAASKGGLIALTHAMAVSLGQYKIRVNALSPGWIETSEWKKRANRRPAHLSATDHEQHPAGRVGKPEDIARAVLFLVDPTADFITGTNMTIDGGMTVKMIYADE